MSSMADNSSTSNDSYLETTTNSNFFTDQPESKTDTISDYFNCSATTYGLLTLTVYPMGIAVVTLLAVLANRHRSCCPRRLRCLYPLNMFDGYKDRFGYACIFGAMTVQLVNVLIPTSTLSGAIVLQASTFSFRGSYPIVTPFVTAAIKILNVGLVTTAFYPLFICITTEYKFIGAIIGSICTLYRFASTIWIVAACQIDDAQLNAGFTMVQYNTLFYNLPTIAFLTGLLAKFAHVIGNCLRKQRLGVYPKILKLANTHHILHVQRLLSKPPLPWHEKDLSNLSIFSVEKFKATFQYKRMPYFRFPTRLIATFVILVSAVYQVGLTVIFGVYSIIKLLQRGARGLQQYNELIGPDATDLLRQLERWLGMANDIWIGTMCITGIMAVLYIYHASICYRKHIFRLYKGDRLMFPESWARESKQSIMTNAVRSAGLQIAFFMWGFVIIQVTLFSFLSVVIFFICLPAFDSQNFQPMIRIMEIMLVPTLINYGIYYTQVLVTRYTFLQPKMKANDSSVPLAVDNRHAFYNFSFFFFFWNIFVGIVSSAMRVLNGILLGILLIPRIDHSVMMRGYETFDAGYLSYLSLLMVIDTHDHPVLRVFLKCLKDGPNERSFINNGQDTAHDRTSRKARGNWLLAYSLINNPSIIRYRKSSLAHLEEMNGTVRHRIVVAERTKMESA